MRFARKSTPSLVANAAQCSLHLPESGCNAWSTCTARNAGPKSIRLSAASSTLESRPPESATVMRAGRTELAHPSSTRRSAARKGSTLFEDSIAGQSFAALDQQRLDRHVLQHGERLRDGVLERIGHRLRVAMGAA